MTNEKFNLLIRAIFLASPINWEEDAIARFLLPEEPAKKPVVDMPVVYRDLEPGETPQLCDQWERTDHPDGAPRWLTVCEESVHPFHNTRYRRPVEVAS
jgi:hypothetical protein